jgi:hypothetical protein
MQSSVTLPRSVMLHRVVEVPVALRIAGRDAQAVVNLPRIMAQHLAAHTVQRVAKDPHIAPTRQRNRIRGVSAFPPKRFTFFEREVRRAGRSMSRHSRNKTDQHESE